MLRLPGEVENELLAHAKANWDASEVCNLRPQMVLGKEMGLLDMVKGLAKVDELAGAMVRVALDGVGKQTIKNSDIGVWAMRFGQSIHFQEEFRNVDYL